jgi:hypothetical protein
MKLLYEVATTKRKSALPDYFIRPRDTPGNKSGGLLTLGFLATAALVRRRILRLAQTRCDARIPVDDGCECNRFSVRR